VIIGIFAVLVLLDGILWGIPNYNVYVGELSGKAQLR